MRVTEGVGPSQDLTRARTRVRLRRLRPFARTPRAPHSKLGKLPAVEVAYLHFMEWPLALRHTFGFAGAFDELAVPVLARCGEHQGPIPPAG